MRRHHFSILAALLLSAPVAWAARKAAPPAAPKTAPPAAPRSPGAGLFRDAAEYPPLQLTWSTSATLEQVAGIFPHPLLPWRAVVTTDTGLRLTDDAGRTWQTLPGAAADKVGATEKVVFHPSAVNTFYLASRSKGVWVTTDNGQTFTQLGSKANGLAADAIADLIVYPADASDRTLLAVHGAAAPGFSRSLNGGQTWDVLNTTYSFRRLVARESDSVELILCGSTKDEPDVQNLYSCPTPGEFAVEFMRDVLPTDLTFVPSARASPLYVATSDGGLYRIDGHQHTIRRLGAKDVNWASLSSTWGPNADVVNLCLYSPAQLGLVLSTNDLATVQAVPGALVSPLIKEGAAIRPNANGTVFYAAINGTLAIGRVAADVPVVSLAPVVFTPIHDDVDALNNLVVPFRDFELAAKTSAAAAARELYRWAGNFGDLYRRQQLTITARLPLQPAPPVAVTVDLSRFDGAPDTPLFDDGRHDDGAAGDGVYGLAFCFQPTTHHRAQDDWRPDVPGRVPLGVVATFADGHRQGAVGVLGIYPPVKSFYLWDGWWTPEGVTEGVTAAVKKESNVPAVAVQNPDEFKHKRSVCALRIETQGQPWSVLLPIPCCGKDDFTSYRGISFWIKAPKGPPPQDVYLQLRDVPVLAEPVTTERVSVRTGMRAGSIGADYRRVVLPFSRLLGKNDPPLQTRRIGRIIISGAATAPATLFINDLQILAPGEEKNPADEPPPP